MEKLKELTQNLKSSPIFNMSLSSKELFHSNFLAWIIETYPQQFLHELSKHVDATFQVEEFKKVHREKENIDLTIEFKNEIIYIENKVKSIPNPEQLTKYKKSKKGIFILLSLFEPSFECSDWKMLTYENIADILEHVSQSISDRYRTALANCTLDEYEIENTDKYIPNDYHLYLIKDYVSVLRNLCELTKYLKLDENTIFNFYDERLELFKDIRLHDLYIKHFINLLSIQVKKDLAKKYESEKLSIGLWYNKQPTGSIIIQTNYSNSKGILHIEYVNDEKHQLGIMIDGQRYLHYMIDRNGTNGNKPQRIEKANNLKDNGQWFVFDAKLDKAGTRMLENEYNKFGDWMLYKAALIPTNFSIKELIDIIAIDIQKASVIQF